MTCHKMGRPPISTSGLGIDRVCSCSRVPRPPHKMTTVGSIGVDYQAGGVHSAAGTGSAVITPPRDPRPGPSRPDLLGASLRRPRGGVRAIPSRDRHQLTRALLEPLWDNSLRVWAVPPGRAPRASWLRSGASA